MSEGSEVADYKGYGQIFRAVKVQKKAVTIRGPRQSARQFDVRVITVRTKSMRGRFADTEAQESGSLRRII